MSFVDKSNTYKVHFTETLNFKIISTTGQSATRKRYQGESAHWVKKMRSLNCDKHKAELKAMMAVFDPIRTKVITHP